MRLSPLMRRIPVILALLLISLCAIQPFMCGQMPLTADGTLHLYRLIALDHALSDGTLWARYVPGMAYGYGAPMFNYYSPLSLYPMLLLHKIGLTFLQSWLWGMVFYTWIAAFGMYLFGKQWGGKIGGLIAAGAYLYAPYMLYDSLWRGTVAEFASLALLPYVLWAITELAWRGRRRDWLMSVLTFALFIPMHNVITLHGTILIGAYSLFLWFQITTQLAFKTLLSRGIILFSPLFIGLLLTAFFWLPALSETNYVKIDAITATNPTIDVVSNLTHLASVFALPITADPTQLQPPISISLSWTQIVFALVAGILIFSSRIRFAVPIRAFVLFGVLLIAVLVIMNTHASAFLWQHLPLIRYSQFPSRLLGLASLLLAVLAGIGVANLIIMIKPQTGKIAVLAVSLASVVTYGFPYLYPIYSPDVNPQHILDLHKFERDSGFITTSSFGEYLPVWNFESPDADKLTSRFDQTNVIPRLEPNSDVIIEAEQWGHTSGQLQITAARETTLTFDWFYFPGWQATLNGQPLKLAPTSPVGLISTVIPAGVHELEISLQRTVQQNLAWVISVAGLVGVMVGVVKVKRTDMETIAEVGVLNLRPLIVTALITSIVLVGVKLTIIDRIDSPIKQERFRNGLANGVETPVNANFGNLITLLGYDLQVKSDESLDLTLYWQARTADIETDYSSAFRLENSDNIPYLQQTTYQPGGLATRHWLPGYYIEENVSLQIPPHTPPGSYSLNVSLYDPQTGYAPDILNSVGNPEGTAVTIKGIELSPSSQTPSLNNAIGFLPSLSLLPSFDFPEQAAVGQPVEFFWTWHLDALQPETTAQIEWLEEGEVMDSSRQLALVEGFPLSQWQPGDTWRGAHRIYIPGNLESGTYDVAIAVGDIRVVVDSMTVTAPERVYEAPEIQYTTNAIWENGIKLLGYNIDPDNALTLYWQTDQPLDESINVFLHLVNQDEIIVSQSTGIPANHTRPTTGWAVGEVVADMVSIPFPSESGLEVLVGWFNPITGERVLLNDGSEFIVLGSS